MGRNDLILIPLLTPVVIEIRKPGEGELKELGIDVWGTWECAVSEFSWEYTDRETCYLFEGEVTVTSNDGAVTFGAGDIVVFPKGLKCIWKVTKPRRCR